MPQIITCKFHKDAISRAIAHPCQKTPESCFETEPHVAQGDFKLIM